MSKRLPTDVWSRSRALASLTAGLASHEVGHRVRSALARSAERLGTSELRTRVAQAKLMAESLGRLKGALMKAGQLLSIDASDFLPPEATEILGALQGNAPPVPFEVVRSVLEEDLGAEWNTAFDHFDTGPAASASIGQVHRATVAGQPVAVKVQYPGITSSIDADLALLEKLASGWLAVSGRRIELGGVFDELATVLHLEADYERERSFLRAFGERLAEDGRFRVPRAFDALSSKRVLTMSWEEGMPLGQWVRAAPPGDACARVAKALLDLYCLEFFQWGMVQTDPNFGNFLVTEGERLVLLDFGATMEFEAGFRRQYVELLRAVDSGRAEAIVDEGVRFGLLDPRESAETRALFSAMLRVAAEPFAAAGQPFSCRDAQYALRSREAAETFVRSLRYSPPPRALLFLHRKLGGLFQLLRKLEVTLDLRTYWEQMVCGAPRSADPCTTPALPTSTGLPPKDS